MFTAKTILAAFILFFCMSVSAQKETESVSKSKAADSLKNISLAGLNFRSIGPAVTGGRITALAVNPVKTSEYYAASGHGSLWKTTNNGVTFSPAFENQTSFGMGAVAIDPSNNNIVWAGTG